MSAQRTFIIIFSIALVVFAACGDAEEDNLDATGSSSPAPSPPVSVSPQPTGADDHSDWATFTDQEFQFSLKYPPELTVEDLSDPTSPLSQRVLDFRLSDGTGFAMVVADNDRNLTPVQWADEYSTCSFEKDPGFEYVNVGGEQAVSCRGEPLAGQFESVIVLAREEQILYFTSTIKDADFDGILAELSLDF